MGFEASLDEYDICNKYLIVFHPLNDSPHTYQVTILQKDLHYSTIQSNRMPYLQHIMI